MKKAQKPLRLNRQTLVRLTEEQLNEIQGAIYPPLDPNYTAKGTYCLTLSGAIC